MMLKSVTPKGYEAIRKLMIKRVEEIDPNHNTAIALSGGVDSTAILFAFLESGRKPDCYTFRLTNYKSDDYKSAKLLCKAFGLKFHEILVPSDVESIVNDIVEILPYCAYVRKTIIQCMIPWLYIYPKLEQDQIVCGFKADDLFQTFKDSQMDLRKYGEEKIRETTRSGSHNEWTDETSVFNIMKFASHFNKKCIDFYFDKDIINEFLDYEIQALHKPFEKAFLVGAFSDYFQKGSFYRKRSNYQINSRLREAHERLLKSEYNINDSKAVIGIYNSIARKMELI